ncbi:MAG: nitrate/nitrite transporter ATP-binding protein [Pseudomonadota bacterium]|jgi:nitrate/nitrite transport system ATP-binding protein
MAFVQLSRVNKGFSTGGRSNEVLTNVNLEIQEGEFVAVVGFSGAGKTTLMSLIAGLQKPDSGEVRVGGNLVTGPSPNRGVVFQNYSLLPWLTVYENIRLAVAEVFPKFSAKQQDEHVLRYIAMVNLSPARDKRPAELSGGMRQRVSVARALSMEPDILLMDEPFGALDALTRAVLQDELGRIWRENRKTVLLITNDVDEGILLADRIIPLSAGPRATLGPAIDVDIARPRERKALNNEPRFKEIRATVYEYLLGSSAQRKRANQAAKRSAESHQVEVPA